ncbi:ABC-ATPase domain-containing protein [Candidatus Riflebacteria bacterium]
MQSASDLQQILKRIDGRGYKAYKDIKGAYQFNDYSLFIDHVQGDPFATPSKIRCRVPASQAAIPETLFNNPIRTLGLESFLVRLVKIAIGRLVHTHRGMGKSGLIEVDVGGQQVIKRTAMLVTGDWLEVRLFLGLPAAGRTILGRQAGEMFFSDLQKIIQSGMLWENIDKNRAELFVNCIENQEFIRQKLAEKNLIAFVADGSLLPRETGFSDKPMSQKQGIPFKSPEKLRVAFQLPNAVHEPFAGENEHSISGMGIGQGVNLIVGGGFHGKSTLLKALERAVYPHIPGDGREYVVSTPQMVKIRAEDGRRVEKVDISAFINNLPGGHDTRFFSTEDASGSTSQASNIIESIEAGAEALLLDEDTCASNFMLRDMRMQALIHNKDEPITPLIDRVREIFDRFRVSTIVVIGGCGDYIDVADNIIMMKEYLPLEKTIEAKQVADSMPSGRKKSEPGFHTSCLSRIPLKESFNPGRGKREVKIAVKSRDFILYGRDEIHLREVEQLFDTSQTRAIAFAVHWAAKNIMQDEKPIKEILTRLEKLFVEAGLDILDPFYRPGIHPGNLAKPRRIEIAAAINRHPSLRIKTGKASDSK